MNKLLSVFLILNALLFSSVVSALQINLSYGKDFIAHHDDLKFGIDLNSRPFPGKYDTKSLHGQVSYGSAIAFAQRVKDMYKETNNLVYPSTLTLGTIKNGNSNIPNSCRINLAGKTVVNVVLNESGCLTN